MEILGPGFSPGFNIIHNIHKRACLRTYGRQDVYLPMEPAPAQNQQSQGLAQGRGGEKARKRLDVIGWESAGQHRGPPTELLPVLGAGQERVPGGWKPELAGRSENAADRSRRAWARERGDSSLGSGREQLGETQMETVFAACSYLV